MSTFQPDEEQKRLIEIARQHFDESLKLPPRHDAGARYFLDKCNSESGIDIPHLERPRKPLHRNWVVRVLEKMLGQDNRLLRVIRALFSK